MLSVKRRLRHPIASRFLLASGALKDVAFNGTKLIFVSGAGNKYDLTGDGVTFTGKLDPRPTYAVVSDVVLRCR